MNRSLSAAVAGRAYLASLATLTLVGVGAVRLASGIDTGAGFQPAFLLLAVAVLASLPAHGRSGPARGWQRSRPWSPWFAASLAAILLSATGLVLAPAPAAAELRWLRLAKQVTQWLVMICFAVYPLLWTRGERRWELTIRLLGVGVLIQAGYALVQAYSFSHPNPLYDQCERWVTSNPAILAGSEELFLGRGFVGIPRLRGTMCEPLYLGSFLLGAVPWLLVGSRRRPWRWALAAAGSGLLVLTWARGAYLGAGAAAVVGAVLARRAGAGPGRRFWLVLATGTALVILAILVVGGTDALLLPLRRIQQSFNREDWSNLTRLYSMQAAWRGFLLSPVCGLGWGQFGFHFPALVDPLGLQSQFAWPVVNNFPLQILCETGVAGGLVLVATAVTLARAVWRGTSAASEAGRRLGPAGRRRVAAGAAAVTGIWVQLLTFSQYNLPHIWVALGLLLAALADADGSPATASREAGGGDR